MENITKKLSREEWDHVSLALGMEMGMAIKENKELPESYKMAVDKLMVQSHGRPYFHTVEEILIALEK